MVFSERIIIVGGADLSEFFSLIFVSKMCVFVSLSLFFGKSVTPQDGFVDFPQERNTFRNTIMEIVGDFASEAKFLHFFIVHHCSSFFLIFLLLFFHFFNVFHFFFFISFILFIYIFLLFSSFFFFSSFFLHFSSFFPFLFLFFFFSGLHQIRILFGLNFVTISLDSSYVWALFSFFFLPFFLLFLFFFFSFFFKNVFLNFSSICIRALLKKSPP